MRKWLAICSGLVASGALQAQVVISPGEMDLGTVLAGPNLQKNLVLHNDGTNPAQITGWTSSCGCLSAQKFDGMLAPGESRTIPLVIRTASLPAGPHAWNLSVSSADTAGGQWNKSGRMVGIVKRDVDLEPGLLALSTDRETIHTVVIRDSRKTPLSVTGWQTTLPGLVVEKRETAGTETRLTVRVPALPEGRHAGSLILATSDEAYRQLEIPVTVLSKKQDSVRMAPELVELSGPAGTTVSRLVRLTANGNLKLKIQEIVVEGVVATTRYAEGPGNSATVRVETNLPAGEAAGRLIIKIEGREQPALLPLTLKGS